MTEPAAFTWCCKSHKILENSAGEKKTNQKREGGGKKSTTRNYVRGFGGRGGSGGDKLCKDRLYKSEK